MSDDERANCVKLQMIESCEQMRDEAYELIERAAALMPIAGRADLSAAYAPFLAGESAGEQLRTKCQTTSDSLTKRLDTSKVTFTFLEDVEDVVCEHRGLAIQYGMATRGGIASLVDSTLDALSALDAINRYRAMVVSGDAVLIAYDVEVKFVAFTLFASVECLQRSWREYAHALNHLGRVPLIAEQMRDHDSVVMRNNGRHKENRADKKRVVEWYAQNSHRFQRDKDGAATASIAEIGLNVKHETVMKWLQVQKGNK